MNQISEHPKSNRSLLLIIALLLIIWVVAIATWIYDEAGYSAGMPMPVFLLHMLAPLLVGLIVGWRKVSLWLGAKAGAIAGALFGAANIAVQLLWGGVLSLLGRISPDQPFTFVESIFEVLEFLVLFTIVGLALGAIGGFFGAFIGGRARGG
jgi:hypothetical protein